VRTYVAVDGGMGDNIRPALYEAKYHAAIVGRAGTRLDTVANRQKRVTVAGRYCESGDILIRDIELTDPKPGDILAVFSTGAYCHAMASNYNRAPRPALVMLRDGCARLSVRRETYDDVIQREK
jgi:diaminopimelate decarboxylase